MLGDVLHSVKGSFALKRGEIRFDPASGKIGGEILFDATSGNSGNQSRDRKMHKEVLESARFSEIGFRPDGVEGRVAATGTSTVQVHGMFRIHGAEHEITVPAEVFSIYVVSVPAKVVSDRASVSPVLTSLFS